MEAPEEIEGGGGVPCSLGFHGTVAGDKGEPCIAGVAEGRGEEEGEAGRPALPIAARCGEGERMFCGERARAGGEGARMGAGDEADVDSDASASS